MLFRSVELCKGYPVFSRDIEGELVTPTGAAIITTLSKGFNGAPPFLAESCGYGAGSKDFGFPALLRVITGQALAENTDTEKADHVVVITSTIDDMSGEFFGSLWEKAFSSGALDLYYSPVIMKKGRPAVELTLLCHPGAEEKMARLLFAETTTIGMRVSREERIKIPYESFAVPTAFGSIAVKVSGDKPSQTVSPEYESCMKAASASEVPVKTVYQAAISAFLQQNQ